MASAQNPGTTIAVCACVGGCDLELEPVADRADKHSAPSGGAGAVVVVKNGRLSRRHWRKERKGRKVERKERTKEGAGTFKSIGTLGFNFSLRVPSAAVINRQEWLNLAIITMDNSRFGKLCKKVW